MMRWVPTGVLMAAALVCMFTSFFYKGWSWLFYVAVLFVIGSLAVNVGVKSEEPDTGSSHHH